MRRPPDARQIAAVVDLEPRLAQRLGGSSAARMRGATAAAGRSAKRERRVIIEIPSAGDRTRQPIEERDRFRGMIEAPNLVVTAWDGELLVGISRSLIEPETTTSTSPRQLHGNGRPAGALADDLQDSEHPGSARDLQHRVDR